MKFIKPMIFLASLVAFQANANVINVALDSDTVAVGDTLTATVTANFVDPVDTFDLNVDFDTSVFSLVDTSVSSSLPDDGFLSYFVWGENPAGLGLTFLTFVDFLVGEVELVSFELEALLPGNSGFSVVSSGLSFFDAPVQLSGTGSATASAVEPVPAPAGLGLAALFMLAFVGLKRRRKQ